MLKKAIWILTFLMGTPALLVWCFLTLNWINPQRFESLNTPQILGVSTQVATQQIPSVSIMSVSYTTADARPLILKKYLSRYESDLEPYANLMVQISDKYSLDYRLLVAIAQQESNLCKRIPENSYNCWGFGIYGDKVTRFDNYPQAFEIIAKALKKNYIDKGLDTPEEIMLKYTPPSVALGGPWAKGVSQFLTDLE